MIFPSRKDNFGYKTFLSAGFLLAASLLTVSLLSAQPVDLEEQVRKIASELRCPVCQNLSVADSPSELARQMRAFIRAELQQGKSPEEIKAYFVSKYGEWILLAPKPKGFRLLLWVLPFIAVAIGIVLVIFVARRWVRKKGQLYPIAHDPAFLNGVQEELKEIEFDYEAGKLSEADYQELRQRLETHEAAVLKYLESSPPPPPQEAPLRRKAPTKEGLKKEKAALRGWRLAAGGAFLLLFGLALGLLLSKSLRPRLSETDTVTGDFLTGTGPGGVDMGALSSRNISSLLAQGRAAFDRQEWSKAIEVFKKVLAIDANQPEAHSYMGLILAQAGHADGALLAFDRALSMEPTFSLALWGKGMVLYRAKEDFSGARVALEKLLRIIPQGEQRGEVQKIIAEVALAEKQRAENSGSAEARPAQTARIEGVVSIDPKIKTKVDRGSPLFIIARPAKSPAGPPLAVKKIDRPVFPLSYSLGPEDVMMPGVPFNGKLLISASLDQDGNPTTREPGKLMGEYKKNPVEIGSKEVNIVIDAELAPGFSLPVRDGKRITLEKFRGKRHVVLFFQEGPG